MTSSTKIEAGFNRISRVQDLSDLAELLFPGNRRHQFAFLAIFLELKWAREGLVPDLAMAVDRYGVTRRVLERCRSRMRRLGLIDHISRFSRRYGGREGWVLSTSSCSTSIM